MDIELGLNTYKVYSIPFNLLFINWCVRSKVFYNLN